MPMIWSGEEWFPVDYNYDSNTGEIIMGLNCLDEDINEWTDEGGEMGTIEAPLVAPLKRPSVIKATSLSSPIPAIAEVGFNISLIPGPPFGPS